MIRLVHARELHIKFTRMRPNTVPKGTEGPLAKAIDDYIGDSPAAEPEEHYKEMDELNPELIDDMMDRMRRGVGADWDQYSDYNSTDDENKGKDEEKKVLKKNEEKKRAPEELFAKMGDLKLA